MIEDSASISAKVAASFIEISYIIYSGGNHTEECDLCRKLLMEVKKLMAELLPKKNALLQISVVHASPKVNIQFK